MILKVAAVKPAGTGTEDGTVSATPASVEIATVRPVEGAADASVTVQVVPASGASVVAAQLKSLIATVDMEIDTDLLDAPSDAVNVTP